MSKEDSKKPDTTFWQKVILGLIAVSIPASVKLFMHHDGEEKFILNQYGYCLGSTSQKKKFKNLFLKNN